MYTHTHAYIHKYRRLSEDDSNKDGEIEPLASAKV